MADTWAALSALASEYDFTLYGCFFLDNTSDVIAAPIAPNCSKRPILLHLAKFSIMCTNAAPKGVFNNLKKQT